MKLIKVFYRIKFNFDVAATQVNWITGKLPEMMATLYILEKLGVMVVGKKIIIFGLIMFASLVLFGYVWRKLGFYEIEQKVNAMNNPVQNEIYEAAKKINNGGK